MFRKSLFVLVYFLFLALLCELIFGAFYFVKNEALVRPARMLSTNEFLVNAGDVDCGWAGVQAVHPFLSHYSLSPDRCADDAQFDLNAQGFFGPSIPLKNDDKTFDILLTGGSVAAYLGQLYVGGPKYLEESLNRKYQPPVGTRFRVFNGANGAWAQPQQMIMTLLYGRGVDALVSLEGFNEHWAFARKRRIDQPTNTFFQLAARSTDATVVFYGDLATDLTHFMNNNWLTRNSYFLYGIYDIVILLVKQKMEESGRVAKLKSSFGFDEGMGQLERHRWNLEQYQTYVLTIKDFADRNNLQHALFIQPVPRIGKTLTNEEQRRIGSVTYEPIYLEIVEHLMALQNQGVNVRGLLYVFEDVTESIYGDIIHPEIDIKTGYGRGFEIIAEQMSDDLAELWRLQPK